MTTEPRGGAQPERGSGEYRTGESSGEHRT